MCVYVCVRVCEREDVLCSPTEWKWDTTPAAENLMHICSWKTRKWKQNSHIFYYICVHMFGLFIMNGCKQTQAWVKTLYKNENKTETERHECVTENQKVYMPSYVLHAFKKKKKKKMKTKLILLLLHWRK